MKIELIIKFKLCKKYSNFFFEMGITNQFQIVLLNWLQNVNF